MQDGKRKNLPSSGQKDTTDRMPPLQAPDGLPGGRAALPANSLPKPFFGRKATRIARPRRTRRLRSSLPSGYVLMPDGDRSYPLEVELRFIFPPELRASLDHPYAHVT
jgi:hypothetical protein